MVTTLHDEIHTSLSIEQLREMIASLSTTDKGEPLQNAMEELKAALKENPEASALMLPEDVGQCVAALRKMTGQEILQQAEKIKSSKTKVTGKVVKFDAETEASLLDEMKMDF